MSLRARFAITSRYVGQTRATNVTSFARSFVTSIVTVAMFDTAEPCRTWYVKLSLPEKPVAGT